MQKFETKCPHCNAELDAQEDWVGMEVECPACQKSFTVEKNIPAKLELQPIQTNVQQPSENTKNCPFCGGVVKEKAIFCKHCKTDLNKTIAQEQKQVESLFIFICPECDTVAELPEVLKDKEYEYDDILLDGILSEKNKKGELQVRTAHSLNQVPFIIYDKNTSYTIKEGNFGLANVAPTVLELLGIEKPDTMVDSMIK